MREVLLIFIPTLTVLPAAIAASMAMRRISLSAIEGITRQPEVAAQLFTSMLIGMALIEALVIYCLVIALMLAGKV
ncbi:MAG: ATP synthase F0 subunit C [Coriobacteriia bacterium]|nr:ATP synthase F0 subunit C [Coriobacteriia bacterium]